MSDHKRLEKSVHEPVWISCDKLSVIWIQAQRPYRPDRAKEIADNFDPDLFDPLKVTKPNGEGIYHICDGQTRKGAVEMLWGPKETVPCYVALEGDPQRAAEIFLRTNTGRRPPNAIDKFKVGVTAQLKNEVNIDRIVRHNGYKVDAASAKDSINAVGALKFVYSVCGPKILDQTLRAIKDTWGQDRNAINGNILRGFGVFLNEFGTYITLSRFHDVTRKRWTPGNLLRDAKAGRELHGGTSTDAIRQLLMENYNKGLKGKPLKSKEAAAA
jgi:hypothetical protein